MMSRPPPIRSGVPYLSANSLSPTPAPGQSIPGPQPGEAYRGNGAACANLEAGAEMGKTCCRQRAWPVHQPHLPATIPSAAGSSKRRPQAGSSGSSLTFSVQDDRSPRGSPDGSPIEAATHVTRSPQPSKYFCRAHDHRDFFFQISLFHRISRLESVATVCPDHPHWALWLVIASSIEH